MLNQNLTISVNRDLGNQAQAVFNDMGLDIVTVIDYFLRNVVRNQNTLTIPDRAIEADKPRKEEMLSWLFASIGDALIDVGDVKGIPSKFGSGEDTVTISDDSNSPLDGFSKVTATAEERRAIVDSLIGSWKISHL